VNQGRACPFISRKLPPCSVICQTETKDIAKGVVKFLTNMGLFIRQSPAFFAFMGTSPRMRTRPGAGDK
jgi:hypothetical protein